MKVPSTKQFTRCLPASCQSSFYTGRKIVATVLYQDTAMNRDVQGAPAAEYLWKEKKIVSFLDAELFQQRAVGLVDEEAARDMLSNARRRGLFGVQLRAAINPAEASAASIEADVSMQFEYAKRLLDDESGVVPLLGFAVAERRPEYEDVLKMCLLRHLDDLSRGVRSDDERKQRGVMLKLTIPSKINFYEEVAEHPNVMRVIGHQGKMGRTLGSVLLSKQTKMIAGITSAQFGTSLSANQDPRDFDLALNALFHSAYKASLA